MQRPKKWNSPEISQKERGIADRQERAADVGGEKDEEDNGVCDARATAVGVEQQSNEQHARAGGSKEARKQGSAGKDHRVYLWSRRELAAQHDAARNDIERTKQHHERDVLLEQSVSQDMPSVADRSGHGKKEQRDESATTRDDRLVFVGMPPVTRRGQQRKHRDAEQEDKKRNCSERPEWLEFDHACESIALDSHA